MGFSKKSQEIIDYRVAHPHLPMPAVASRFGVKHQWVFNLCKRAGVQTGAIPYEGMDCHLKGIPRELVEAVKTKANSEGMTMKLKTIDLWENYVKGIDKT